MVLTLEQKDSFLRKKKQVSKIILNQIRKEKGIIFGARSVNKQVPKHLRSHTEDFDVLVEGNPKTLAKRIERKLDKKFGGNFYSVKDAQHEGTKTVKNNLSGKGVADISKREEKVGFVKRKGVRFAKLSFQEKKIRQSLADPKSKFRHQKDKFSRDRIKLSRIKKKKKKKPIRKFKTNFNKLTSRAGLLQSGIGRI